MLSLSAKVRDISKTDAGELRQKDILPAVLYGYKIKNLNLEVDLKEFENVYKEAGESSLISLEVEGQKDKSLVLIYDVQKDSLSGKPIHVDFYQPALKEEVETTVSIVFEGEAPAVKNLGGTLIKNISEIEVKALPQNLPKEIKVNIEGLKELEDNILVKDLELPTGVKVKREPKDILVSVLPPEKVEEALEKPIEEKVDEVEKIKEEKKAEPKAEKQSGLTKTAEVKEKKEAK